MIGELEDFSIKVDVIDPCASAEEVKHEFDLDLKKEGHGLYDAFIIAVDHKEFKSLKREDFLKMAQPNPIIFDVKGIHPENKDFHYFKL